MTHAFEQGSKTYTVTPHFDATTCQALFDCGFSGAQTGALFLMNTLGLKCYAQDLLEEIKTWAKPQELQEELYTGFAVIRRSGRDVCLTEDFESPKEARDAADAICAEYNRHQLTTIAYMVELQEEPLPGFVEAMNKAQLMQLVQEWRAAYPTDRALMERLEYDIAQAEGWLDENEKYYKTDLYEEQAFQLDDLKAVRQFISKNRPTGHELIKENVEATGKSLLCSHQEWLEWTSEVTYFVYGHSQFETAFPTTEDQAAVRELYDKDYSPSQAALEIKAWS